VEAAETQLTPPALDDGSPVTLSLRDVSVLFKGKAAVRNVTFDVHANKVTSLIGPSGSGKTTLLRSMNRLHELTHDATVTGQILLDPRHHVAQPYRDGFSAPESLSYHVDIRQRRRRTSLHRRQGQDVPR
jgi:ABC-type multidrug transport system ATPase subunit